ncbi:MAG: flavin reductase family protein [Propionicimonas sp.]|nr:flavin reductase family protein [Propionicimonas sp.]
MTIHTTHPFADPDWARGAVRRFRGRLAHGVTLWASGTGRDRAGLTVSSLMVAGGEPGRVLALLDPLSDLAGQLQQTGTAAVTLLRHDEHYLAQVFAGLAPAPGGRFTQTGFADTGWGPVLAGERTWAGLRLETAVEVGWSTLATCVLEHLELADETDPLIHLRGRYPRLA